MSTALSTVGIWGMAPCNFMIGSFYAQANTYRSRPQSFPTKKEAKNFRELQRGVLSGIMDELELANLVNRIEAAILEIAALKRMIAGSTNEANTARWKETVFILEGRQDLLQSILETERESE